MNSIEELELIVLDSVYKPREDSFILAKNVQIKPNSTVLDLGTGTGIQGINTALQKAKHVLCTDINEKALENAQKNVKKLQLNNLSFKKSNLFDNIQEKFDYIIFNPPYLPSEKIKDITLDGGKQGREIIDKFISKAKNYLNSKGTIYLLISSHNNEKEIFKLLKKQCFQVSVLDRQKFFFEEIIVLKAKLKN